MRYVCVVESHLSAASCSEKRAEAPPFRLRPAHVALPQASRVIKAFAWEELQLRVVLEARAREWRAYRALALNFAFMMAATVREDDRSLGAPQDTLHVSF